MAGEKQPLPDQDDELFGSHPDRYRTLSAPFETPDECNEAVRAFFADVARARIKHRMQDVHVIVSGHVKYGDDVEGADGAGEAKFILPAHFGNPDEALPMCSWAAGHEDAVHRAKMNVLFGGGAVRYAMQPSRPGQRGRK
jgi:hypothetical protein